MKCIQCGTDNTLSDRTSNQGRCKSCHHPFVFEPTSMGTWKFTDPFFKQMLTDISANNTVYFTRQQLLYFLDQRLRSKQAGLMNQVGLGCLYLFLLGWSTIFFTGLLSALFGEITAPIVVGIYNLLWLIGLFRLSDSSTTTHRTRKLACQNLQLLGVVILIVGIAYSIITDTGLGYAITLGLGLSAFWLAWRQKGRLSQIADDLVLSASHVSNFVTQWEAVNGAIAQLLPAPPVSLPPTAIEGNAPPSPHSDVTDYSFDRLLVCESAAIAQMLIANNFHFEHNCAILSITGYPQAIFQTTLDMVRRNPELQVYALHNCTADGLHLIHQLRSPEWFSPDLTPASVTIVDVGLLPRQLMTARRSLMVQQSTAAAATASRFSPEIRNSFSPEELRWLEAGYFAEIESIPPQRLLQILQRSITSSQVLDASSTDSGWLLIGDSGSGIYASDSFG